MPTVIYKHRHCSEETKRKIGLANSKPPLEVVCKICSKVFFTYPARKGKAKFCSYRCMGISQKGRTPWNRGKHTGNTPWNKGKKLPNLSGENHPNWRGGRYISNGYVLVYSPRHPNKSSDGYVLEHRLVMEQYLNRYLKPEEVVHHIDKNTSNNHINNLMLFKTDREHRKFHNEIKRRIKNEPRKRNT